MAVNITNETTITDTGVVASRFYQVYKDHIESKEVMEPIAIVAGTGPICGFDWVDLKPAGTAVLSSLLMPSGSLPENQVVKMLRAKSHRVYLSDKGQAGEVKSGLVPNAFVCPDGLLAVADPNVEIMLEGHTSWPAGLKEGTAGLQVFAVKATHAYVPDPSGIPITNQNFTGALLNAEDFADLESILKADYPTIMSMVSGPLNFDQSTDCIIGIYLIGWHSSWPEKYKAMISSMAYTLCLVPLEGKFPVSPWGLHPLVIQDLMDEVAQAEARLKKAQEEFQETMNKKFQDFSDKLDKDLEDFKAEIDQDIYQFELSVSQDLAIMDGRVTENTNNITTIKEDLKTKGEQIDKLEKGEFAQVNNLFGKNLKGLSDILETQVNSQGDGAVIEYTVSADGSTVSISKAVLRGKDIMFGQSSKAFAQANITAFFVFGYGITSSVPLDEITNINQWRVEPLIPRNATPWDGSLDWLDGNATKTSATKNYPYLLAYLRVNSRYDKVKGIILRRAVFMGGNINSNNVANAYKARPEDQTILGIQRYNQAINTVISGLSSDSTVKQWYHKWLIVGVTGSDGGVERGHVYASLYITKVGGTLTIQIAYEANGEWPQYNSGTSYSFSLKDLISDSELSEIMAKIYDKYYPKDERIRSDVGPMSFNFFTSYDSNNTRPCARCYVEWDTSNKTIKFTGYRFQGVANRSCSNVNQGVLLTFYLDADINIPDFSKLPTLEECVANPYL